MSKGKIVILHPDGTKEERNVSRLDIAQIQKLVGGYVERTKVRYEGRPRDCYLNEEGILRGLPWNNQVKLYAKAYWNCECQIFAGVGVIWIPTPRSR